MRPSSGEAALKNNRVGSIASALEHPALLRPGRPHSEKPAQRTKILTDSMTKTGAYLCLFVAISRRSRSA
jgi:hypothetical protein